jgi:hypothetical protein
MRRMKHETSRRWHWSLLKLDLLLLAIGAALTIWGLAYEIWPLERARQGVAESTVFLQRLDNQLIELRQFDADFLQAQTYELLQSFIATTVQDASLKAAMLQKRGDEFIRPLFAMLAHTQDTSSGEAVAVSEYNGEVAKVQQFVDELKKEGTPSAQFQSYIKILRLKFLKKLDQTLTLKDHAIDKREKSRKDQDYYSLWSGVLKAIGFVLLLLSTLVGLKLIERNSNCSSLPACPLLRPLVHGRRNKRLVLTGCDDPRLIEKHSDANARSHRQQ